MNKLKEEWEYFYNLPYPDYPNNQDLANIFDDLLEIDGHIAGIVDSFLKGIKVKKSLIYVDEEFNRKLNAFEPKDSQTEKEWLAIKNYKDELDKLTRMVLELYDEV